MRLARGECAWAHASILCDYESDCPALSPFFEKQNMAFRCMPSEGDYPWLRKCKLFDSNGQPSDYQPLM